MHAEPTPLTASRSGPLKGRARVPGDKSISHRALILGALTVGETRITGLLEGEDVLNTAQGGAGARREVERTGDGAWRVHGVGVGGFAAPAAPLDFGNSGTGCRLMIGAVAGCPITATFDGDASLRTRPDAARARSAGADGRARCRATRRRRLPLTLAGARDPIPIVYEPPVAVGAAQIRRAARRPRAPGETVVIEAEATRDHTETHAEPFRRRRARRAARRTSGRRITLAGQPELEPRPIAVPADPSSAAFPLVAALIVPGSDVILEGVMTESAAHRPVATLREMGAAIEPTAIARRRRRGRRRPARARLPARGVEVPAERAPAMIDEYPVLAVAAAFAEGTTRDARAEGVAGEGIATASPPPPRMLARERRRGRDRGRRPHRRMAGRAPSAAASSPPTWITASPWPRW